MASVGLLPTPNSPRLNSNNTSDFIKPSLFPLPYQATHIIESLEINASPTWLLNVTKDSINFKIEWDVVDKPNSNKPPVVFPKPVIQSLSTYNVHEPVWSTSLSNKKICLKIDWKFMNSNQPPSQLNPKSPVYSPTSFITPNKHSYTPNMDSGYYPSTSPYLHNKSRVYTSSGSPFPHTNLFHHPESSPNRQDIYITPTKPKPNPTEPPSNKVNPKIPKTPANETQTHPVNTTKAHSSSSNSVSTDNTILKPNIVPEIPSKSNTSTTSTVDSIKPPNLPASESSGSPSPHTNLSHHPKSTSPTKSNPNPNEPPSNKVIPKVNDTQVHPVNTHPDTTKAHSSSSESVPTTSTNTQDTSTTQTVDPIKPPNLPESEPSHLPDSPTISDPKGEEYPPPEPHLPSDHIPSSNTSKPRKRKKKNKKNISSYVGSTPALNSVAPSNNTIMNEVKLIATDPKFVVHKDSTDGEIMLIPDPLNEDANPGEDLFIKTPDDLKIDDRGLIDASLKACWIFKVTAECVKK